MPQQFVLRNLVSTLCCHDRGEWLAPQSYISMIASFFRVTIVAVSLEPNVRLGVLELCHAQYDLIVTKHRSCIDSER